jgi:hypothetical protein
MYNNKIYMMRREKMESHTMLKENQRRQKMEEGNLNKKAQMELRDN